MSAKENEMKILHKTIRREPWERVIKRTQNFFFSDDGGAVSLLRFDKLTSPIIRDYGDGLSGTVAMEGGYWLQLAYDGDNYWYTSYFDPEGNFRQVYADITAGNDCKTAENASFDDLFSDVVYTAEGNIYVFDEDELSSALSEGIIDEQTYENVRALTNALVARFRKDGEAIKAKLISLFNQALALL